MANAYKCDVCGKYIDGSHTISGFEFKIGEYHDEFTGTYDKMQKVKDICGSCYNELISKIKEIYDSNVKE